MSLSAPRQLLLVTRRMEARQDSQRQCFLVTARVFLPRPHPRARRQMGQSSARVSLDAQEKDNAELRLPAWPRVDTHEHGRRAYVSRPSEPSHAARFVRSRNALGEQRACDGPFLLGSFGLSGSRWADLPRASEMPRIATTEKNDEALADRSALTAQDTCTWREVTRVRSRLARASGRSLQDPRWAISRKQP